MPNRGAKSGASLRRSVILILCIALSLAGAGCRKAKSEDLHGNVQQSVEPIPEYELVDIRDLSFLNCVRKQVTVQTTRRLSEAEVTRVAQSVVSKVTSEHSVNAVSILMYDTPHTTGSYTLASVDWAPNGDWTLANTVNTGDYSIHKFTVHTAPERPPEPEVIGSLPRAKAKQCFLEICRAQDRASNEAEMKYPSSTDVMKQAEYAQTLSNQYEQVVREKYGITQTQQSEIVAAGIIQSWPMY